MAEDQRAVTLIAVQMRVQPEDYQSADTFSQAIDRCMQKASQHFGKGENLVVFPEDVGLGLLLVDQYDQIRDCTSIREAAEMIAVKHSSSIQEFCRKYHCSSIRAFCLDRSPLAQKIMGDTFSKMAKKYQVTLVAGSAPVPGPDGTVYNVSTVFSPDGQVLGSQKKLHLVDDETESGLDLTPGSLNEIHAIDTPAGRLGIAICYDAFFEDVVDRLASEKATILVQPSFNPGQWTPEQKSDWKQGTWTAVRTHSNFIAGVNPMMVGSLWDIRPEGQSSIISGSGMDKEDGYLARSVTSDQEEVISSTIFVHN